MRQHYQKLLAAIVAGCCLGCQPGTEAPASVAEEAPVAASEAGAQAPTELAFTERAVLFPPELYQLYEKLNMRSFNSSFGPRLRHHCESYLIEFFPRDDIVIDSPTQMTLTAGDDMWVIEILGPGRIRVDNYITGSGSYSSSKELDVAYIDASEDIRSDETWIERRSDCTPLHPDENKDLILLD